MMPHRSAAGAWGGFTGLAPVLGAVAGFPFKLPRRFIAGVIAFGSGVMISAMAYIGGGLIIATISG